MADGSPQQSESFGVALARALAGAVIFALPVLMTMEMWQIGHRIDPLRLAFLVLLGVPLLTGLAWYVGFREDVSWGDAVLDAFVAYAVAAVAAASILLLIGVLDGEVGWRDGVGKLAIQLVPAGIGATLARNQLGQDEGERDAGRRDSVPAELFLMAGGALFLSLNIAPTQEVMVIARQITPWHALALAAVTLAGMHALVYGLRFRGQHERRPDTSFLAEFTSLTIAGYAAALLVSALVLWLLGQLDGVGLLPALHMLVVLGLPAGIGAAAARVVL